MTDKGERKRQVKIVTMKRLTQAQRTDLIMIGQRMSNVFYNMNQQDDVPESWRKSGKELQQEWDAIRWGR